MLLLEREQEAAEKHGPAAGAVRNEEGGGLFTLGLWYLALPCVLFLTFFVQPWLGIPIAFGIILVSWRLSEPWSPRLSPPTLLAAGLAFALALLIGILTGHSAWDWIKHWALINELANHEWPVTLSLQGETRYLRFYIAAYLVPALVTKLSPGWPVTVATTAWFALGFGLVFRMACAAHSKRPWPVVAAAMVIPLLLAGADSLASHGLRALAGQPATEWLGLHYENWFPGKPLQFASALTNLAWAPHQSIAVFIAAAMIVFDRGRFSIARAILAFGLLALWSPFGMIGLLPIICLRTLPGLPNAFNWATGAAILIGGSFAVVVAAYLSTDLPPGGLCLTCGAERLAELDDLLIFLIVELAASVLLLRGRILTDPLCATAFLSLLGLLFLRGDTIDFVARGSMGPLFILALRSTDRLLAAQNSPTGWLAAALALLLCLPTTASEIVYHASNGAAHREADARLPTDRRWLSVFSQHAGIDAKEFLDVCGWKYEGQYFSASRPWVLRAASKAR
jgi:hypothetical protein